MENIATKRIPREPAAAIITTSRVPTIFASRAVHDTDFGIKVLACQAGLDNDSDIITKEESREAVTHDILVFENIKKSLEWSSKRLNCVDTILDSRGIGMWEICSEGARKNTKGKGMQ